MAVFNLYPFLRFGSNNFFAFVTYFLFAALYKSSSVCSVFKYFSYSACAPNASILAFYRWVKVIYTYTPFVLIWRLYTLFSKALAYFINRCSLTVHIKNTLNNICRFRVCFKLFTVACHQSVPVRTPKAQILAVPLFYIKGSLYIFRNVLTVPFINKPVYLSCFFAIFIHRISVINYTYKPYAPYRQKIMYVFFYNFHVTGKS